MKVAILEPHNYHFDVLNSQCQIFRDKIEYIILNEEVLLHLENKEKYKKVITLKKLTCFETLKIIFFLNKSDVDYIFMPTIQSHLLFYFFFFLFCNKKKIPTIHNINTYYVYPKKFKAKIKFFIRKLIILKSFGINVLGEELGNYLKKMGYKKLILSIPARLYMDKKKKDYLEQNKEFVISIPGSFETKRRDYQVVYNVYKKLIKDKKNIKINFLGSCFCKNKNDMELFDKFEKIGNIFYKKEFILEEEFKIKIEESDVLLSPTRLNFKYGDIIEKYGESKQTGFIYLPIEFSKIAIVPKELKIDKKLKSSTLKYKNEKELYDIISKLYEDNIYKEKLQKEAIINSKKFELKIVRQDILNNIYNYEKLYFKSKYNSDNNV